MIPIPLLHRIPGVPRWRAIVAALLMVSVLSGLYGAPAAVAQDDRVTCSSFATQAEAQAAFDAGEVPNRALIDQDADGVACNEYFNVNGGPPVRDYTTCGHFETQADAQAALDAGNLPHPEFLDGDGDGIACEDAFGEVDGGPPARDYTSCGHFETQQDAQKALDSGQLPHPEFLDGDGDGIACEEAFEQDTDASPGAPVSALPSTGAGPSGPDAGMSALLLGFGLAATVLALALRRQARLVPR
jgi:hypothetical protein